MVTALHVVAKAADGPAPTVVTVGHYPAGGADFASAPDVIDVAVIDNGIDPDFRQDGWLNEVERHNGNGNDYNIDQLTVLGDPDLLDFAAGHGTFVAGIVRQVDPEARVVVYRVLDSDGLGSEADVAAAMVRAADAGAKVICLSLGMRAVDDSADKRCPALEAAVKHIQSLDNPPAIVASAGNDGTEVKVYPAALEGVVGVAALEAGWEDDPEQTPGAKWSTHGDWVTCSAVGEGIVSTFVKGEEDPQFGGHDVYPEAGQDDSWAVWTGTSFAAPQVAGHISKACRAGATPKAAVEDLFPTQGRPGDGYGTRVVLLPGTRPTT